MNGKSLMALCFVIHVSACGKRSNDEVSKSVPAAQYVLFVFGSGKELGLRLQEGWYDRKSGEVSILFAPDDLIRLKEASSTESSTRWTITVAGVSCGSFDFKGGFEGGPLNFRMSPADAAALPDIIEHINSFPEAEVAPQGLDALIQK